MPKVIVCITDEQGELLEKLVIPFPDDMTAVSVARQLSQIIENEVDVEEGGDDV